MAQDSKPVEEMTAIAKQTMAQAQNASEQYFSWLQKSMTPFPWPRADLGQRLLSMMQQNFAANLEFAQKLGQAKDFNDVARIQTEFVQSSLQTLGKQMKELTEASTKSPMDVVKKAPD